MAYTLIPGDGLWMPGIQRIQLGAPALADAGTIDATGEKLAFCGRFFHKSRASKDITKVHFRFGTVVKAGGSALTVSLQDVSTTAGEPVQPDETQDQTVAIANADASFVSNTWYTTGALSANRTITHGTMLAVVVEYDGGGRLGADAVSLSCLTGVSAGDFMFPGTQLKTASWATRNYLPNVILECTDGSFGTIDGGFPLSATSSTAFGSGSNPDEHALEFQVPFPCKVDGCCLLATRVNSGSDMDVILYDGTTPMTNGSVSQDGNTWSGARLIYVTFPGEVTLAANTTYRLAMKPTTTNTVTVYYFDVADANHFQAHCCGPAWSYTTRVDAGAWAAATATRRPFMWLRVSSLDDGVGGGAASMMRPVAQSGGLV